MDRWSAPLSPQSPPLGVLACFLPAPPPSLLPSARLWAPLLPCPFLPPHLPVSLHTTWRHTSLFQNTTTNSRLPLLTKYPLLHINSPLLLISFPLRPPNCHLQLLKCLKYLLQHPNSRLPLITCPLLHWHPRLHINCHLRNIFNPPSYSPLLHTSFSPQATSCLLSRLTNSLLLHSSLPFSKTPPAHCQWASLRPLWSRSAERPRLRAK